MIQEVVLWSLMFACLFNQQVWSLKRDTARGINYGNFLVDKFHYLDVDKVASTKVTSFGKCGFACVSTGSCFSFNVAATSDDNGKLWCELLATDKYNNSDKFRVEQSSHHYSINTPCSKSPCPSGSKCIALYEEEDHKCEQCRGNKCFAESCQDLRLDARDADGVLSVIINGTTLHVYCDMTTDNKGWTLVARFSNNDNNNWMKNDGDYWYDRQSAVGKTTDPAANKDMISPAFWSVNGTEFKITRSDDPSHTALLQTTSNCLGGMVFRSKITSYGAFRNREVWASDECLGSCEVQYGGQYRETAGFSMAECNGEIQSMTKIGFWCDYKAGDGAVLMIGGGGSTCDRADHGIGITEAGAASFYTVDIENDFGSGTTSPAAAIKLYSLNLWVR